MIMRLSFQKGKGMYSVSGLLLYNAQKARTEIRRSGEGQEEQSSSVPPSRLGVWGESPARVVQLDAQMWTRERCLGWGQRSESLG